MARLLCLKNKTGEVKEVECKKLQDYYDNLECDCFDIVALKIGNRVYDCFVDDEGLFKEDILPSAIHIASKEPMLVGNIIFANYDVQGNTTSLSDADISNIKEHIMHIIFFSGGRKPKLLESNAVLACYPMEDFD